MDRNPNIVASMVIEDVGGNLFIRIERARNATAGTCLVSENVVALEDITDEALLRLIAETMALKDDEEPA